MKAELVNQKDWKPTRKHFLGAVAGIATAAVLGFTNDLAATHSYLSFLSGDAALAGIPLIVGYGVSYLAKERATS